MIDHQYILHYGSIVRYMGKFIHWKVTEDHCVTGLTAWLVPVILEIHLTSLSDQLYTRSHFHPCLSCFCQALLGNRSMDHFPSCFPTPANLLTCNKWVAQSLTCSPCIQQRLLTLPVLAKLHTVHWDCDSLWKRGRNDGKRVHIWWILYLGEWGTYKENNISFEQKLNFCYEAEGEERTWCWGELPFTAVHSCFKCSEKT